MSKAFHAICVMAALLGSVSAAQAACECGAIPVEGIYAGSGTSVAITHVDGSAEQCPQNIRIQVPRTEAPDADVVLSCRGGGLYEAVEPTVVGDMGWRVRALRGGLEVAGNELRIASQVEITVTPRPVIGAPQTWVGTTSNPRAPECLCAEVRAEREFAAEMVATLEDKALQEFAEGIAMRGKNPSRRYAIDDNGVVTKLDANDLEFAFIDMVSGIVEGRMSFANGDLAVYGSVESKAAQTAAQAGSGAMLDSSAGDTNPRTCEMRIRQGSCSNPVLLDAIRAHEAVHVENCREQNARKSFTWLDGSHMEGWPAEGHTGAFLIYRGVSLPTAPPYDLWSDTVANIARDEAAAYRAELPVYDAFLQTYCSS